MNQLSFLSMIILIIFCIFILPIEGKKRVMPWMCLERCGDTKEDIDDQLKQIHDRKILLSGVSFELYNLGPNSSLLINNLTSVGPTIKKLNLETFPMISSYPYPPEFLDWMRQVFKNPENFFNQAIDQLKQTGFTGYNVDWEPTSKATKQDALDYANFLDSFAKKLHSVGAKLNVDVATWSDIWDWNALAKTQLDSIFIMSTYTKNFTLYEKFLKEGIDSIGSNKLGVGLECDTKKYTDKELQARFTLLKHYGVQEIDIWRMGIPETWWSFIESFVFS